MMIYLKLTDRKILTASNIRIGPTVGTSLVARICALSYTCARFEKRFQNPAVAGFVIKPEDWKYSSARDFCGMKGLVQLSYS